MCAHLPLTLPTLTLPPTNTATPTSMVITPPEAIHLHQYSLEKHTSAPDSRGRQLYQGTTSSFNTLVTLLHLHAGQSTCSWKQKAQNSCSECTRRDPERFHVTPAKTIQWHPPLCFTIFTTTTISALGKGGTALEELILAKWTGSTIQFSDHPRCRENSLRRLVLRILQRANMQSVKLTTKVAQSIDHCAQKVLLDVKINVADFVDCVLCISWSTLHRCSIFYQTQDLVPRCTWGPINILSLLSYHLCHWLMFCWLLMWPWLMKISTHYQQSGKWHQLVAKFVINASGATWWPNL